MRTPLRWLLHLYPRAWRQRYGEEFETLLRDTESSWQQIPDILTEALKMRIAATNWKILISFALGGLALAVAGSFGIPERYVSTAVGEITLPAGTSPDAAMAEIIRLEGKVLSRTSLSNIISSPESRELYKEERATQPLEDVIRNMKTRDLKIAVKAKPHGNTQVFSVQFAARNRFTAQVIVQKILSRIADESEAVRSPMAFAVLDLPSLPVKSVSPNRTVIAILGLLAGLVVGGLFAWRRSRSAAGSQAN